MVKQLRQVAGVQQVKVVDFRQGHFRLTPRKGVRLSDSNIAAAVRRSGFTLEKIVAPSGTSGGKGAVPPSPGRSEKGPASAEISQLLAEPRKAFRDGDYRRAVKLADGLALQVRRHNVDRNDSDAQPRNSSDAELFQFLSLVYFASEKYEDAAKAAHVALHRGSPWNWKTLSGHYQNADRYVAQLRTLEKSIREQPSAEKRFLIGYHYLMLGYKKAARAQLTRAAEKNSDDKVIQALLRNLKPGKSR